MTDEQLAHLKLKAFEVAIQASPFGNDASLRMVYNQSILSDYWRVYAEWLVKWALKKDDEK